MPTCKCKNCNHCIQNCYSKDEGSTWRHGSSNVMWNIRMSCVYCGCAHPEPAAEEVEK